jgi:hypothetical protein
MQEINQGHARMPGPVLLDPVRIGPLRRAGRAQPRTAVQRRSLENHRKKSQGWGQATAGKVRIGARGSRRLGRDLQLPLPEA